MLPAVDWTCASHRVVLNLSCTGSYVHIHMLGRGLSFGGLIAANSGEDIVNREPRSRSEHQVVWTIPSNCRSGGIIGIWTISAK